MGTVVFMVSIEADEEDADVFDQMLSDMEEIIAKKGYGLDDSYWDSDI